MPLYDGSCDDCGTEFEERRPADAEVGPCPKCNSTNTRCVWLTVPRYERVKDPYDKLHGVIPDSKPIKSYGNDRRRGGKDRT